ncbi:hypothetical protein ACWEPO_12965, partial [Streptomyces albidoflavus]
MDTPPAVRRNRPGRGWTVRGVLVVGEAGGAAPGRGAQQLPPAGRVRSTVSWVWPVPGGGGVVRGSVSS